MFAKLLDSLAAIRGFANQCHIRLGLNQYSNALTHDRVIINRQNPFPPPAPAAAMSSAPIQVHIQNSSIANLNLGTQMGAINAALQLLSSEGEEHRRVAEALKPLTDAVIADQNLKENQKQEAVEVLAVLANDAESGKTSIATKALVSWLPNLIGLSADLVTVWDKAGPTIRAFFKF